MVRVVALMMLAQLPPNYGAARDTAIREGTALVVGVGCAAPFGEAWKVCNVKSLEGFKAPCIVVSRPKDGNLWHVETLKPWTSKIDIERLLKPAPAPQRWNPYTQPRRDPATGRRISFIGRLSGGNC